MATNNAVNNGLSGATGTGSFVGSTSPTLTTPTIGAATATTITFSPTTGGIVGTTTNNNTTAGNVGEFVDSGVVSQNPTTSTVAFNITSISLTAGDWDVSGTYFVQGSANTTVTTSSISTTSATLATQGSTAYNQFSLGAQYFCTLPVKTRLSLSTTTTVYLVGNVTYTTLPSASVGQITARRRR